MCALSSCIGRFVAMLLIISLLLVVVLLSFLLCLVCYLFDGLGYAACGWVVILVGCCFGVVFGCLCLLLVMCGLFAMITCGWNAFWCVGMVTLYLVDYLVWG